MRKRPFFINFAIIAINTAFTWSYGHVVSRFFLASGKIDDTEVAIQVLIAFTVHNYVFKTPYDDGLH